MTAPMRPLINASPVQLIKNGRALMDGSSPSTAALAFSSRLPAMLMYSHATRLHRTKRMSEAMAEKMKKVFVLFFICFAPYSSALSGTQSDVRR